MDTEISLKESLAFGGSRISPGESVYAFVFYFDFSNFRILFDFHLVMILGEPKNLIFIAFLEPIFC